MLIKKITGEDIKNLRETLHLTQEEFSRKFNVPVSTLKHWEQGAVKLNSSVLALLNILNQLTKRKCSTQDFLYELLYEPKTQRRRKL